jgi:hypothetical protein
MLHDIRAVATYVNNNLIHARLTVTTRAWCVCPRSSVCVCPMLGTSGDPVYDAARYALSRLLLICQNYDGTGLHAYSARVCMAAYLPLTALYDVRRSDTFRVEMATAAKLVDIDAVSCFNTLPNLCHVIYNASFWYETSTHKETTIEYVFEHVFGKAFPLRCHFRNMQKICILYGSRFDEFADFMVSIVRCSMLGLYPNAASSCSYEAMRRVDVLFTPTADMDGGRRCEYVCRFGYIMFHAVKEYLCSVTSGMAGLRDVLNLTYRWWTFEDRVFRTMSQIRVMLSNTFVNVDWLADDDDDATDATMLDPASSDAEGASVELMQGSLDVAYAERPLTRWNRSTKSMTTSNDAQLRPKQDRRVACLEIAMGPVEDRAYRLNNEQEKNMYHLRKDAPPAIIRTCLGRNLTPREDTAKGVVRYEPFRVEDAAARMTTHYGIEVGLAARIVEGIDIFNITGYIGSRMRAELGAATLPTATAMALSRYCEDIDISSMFNFVPLPWSIRVAQLDAIRRKFTIMEYDTNEAELCALSDVFFCLACMSFKAFVVENASNASVACGFVGTPNVVYDYFNKQLKCRHCTSASRMFRFQLAGMAVRVGQHTHVLCTDCSSVTFLDPFAYKGDEYVCGACSVRRKAEASVAVFQVDSCPVPSCSRPMPTGASSHQLSVTDDTAGGCHRVVVFCRQHRYIAARIARSTTVLSELLERVDLAIKDAGAPSRRSGLSSARRGVSTQKLHPALRLGRGGS